MREDIIIGCVKYVWFNEDDPVLISHGELTDEPMEHLYMGICDEAEWEKLKEEKRIREDE